MSYISTCLADGAVGLWVLGESLVASAAVDQAGNSNGTYMNTSGITLGQTGIPGGGGATAAQFTAGTGYVDVPDSAGQNFFGNTFTLEAWVKFAHDGNGQRGLIAANNGSSYMWEISNVGNLVGNKNSLGQLCHSTITVPDDGAFHHVVWARLNNPGNALYIDGVDSAVVDDGNSIVNSSGISLCRKGITNADFYNGGIQFAAIYPTQLTPTVVGTHYALGSTGPVTTVTVPGPAPLLGRMGR